MATMLMAACTSDNNNDSENLVAQVNVQVADFAVSTEGIASRAVQSAAEYTNVKAITLAFFHADGTVALQTTQLRADDSTYDTFGSFSVTLPYGDYTMMVMGYGSETPVVINSMTDVAFSEDRVREMLTFTRSVSIRTETIDLSATLNRIVARLGVVSTDGRPANAPKVRLTVSKGGKTFNPMTGLSLTDTGFANEVELTSAVDAVSRTQAYLFLASDEETMDVTIETLDTSDNVLFSKTVTNVPFQRNRMTLLTGSMYSPSSPTAGSFLFETSWLDDTNINF